jgi:glycosyltransferase involved in cell wall biosynthesis
MGRQARHLPRSDLVRPANPGGEIPVDDTWVAQDLFHTANRSYGRLGRFTPLSLAGQGRRPQVMHWTTALPIRLSGVPNVYTIHDLAPLRLPFATLDNKSRFYRLVARLCRDADQIVTVSETVKSDLVRVFDAAPERISTTYQAVDIPLALRERPENEVARDVEGLFGLAWRGYFLFFGAVEPKKNLARIIEAYLSSGVKTPLVIVGGKGWLTETETAMMYEDVITAHTLRDEVIRRSDRIRRYDYLPFGSLVSLIRGARATIFPSLYEGFGLPVLESMQLGAPVLTSTAGALPELAGEAALSVDPYDAQAIKRGIIALDNDADLRRDLSERGRVQAQRFSMAAYRERLEALYARLA